MLGKKKCRILKEIRQKIADENDIPYVTHECKFQGECKGTCPRCESELKYLEKQLAARAAAGKRIAIAALCAGMTFSMAGCASPFANDKGGDKSGTEDLAGMMDEPDEVYVTTGEVESGRLHRKGRCLLSGKYLREGRCFWSGKHFREGSA